MIGKKESSVISQVLGDNKDLRGMIVAAPKALFEAAAELGVLSRVPTIDYDVDRFSAVFKEALQFSLHQVDDVIAGTAKPMVLDHRNGNQVQLTLDNFEDLIKPDGADTSGSLDA